MTQWTSEELAKIDSAEELEIAPRRADGTLHKPVTIWVVRAGDDLYVRSYKGNDGLWYRAALVRHEGRIQAGGVEKEVAFVEETDPGVNAQLDAAYRSKYRRHEARYVDPMVVDPARAATLKLTPMDR